MENIDDFIANLEKAPLRAVHQKIYVMVLKAVALATSGFHIHRYVRFIVPFFGYLQKSTPYAAEFWRDKSKVLLDTFLDIKYDDRDVIPQEIHARTYINCGVTAFLIDMMRFNLKEAVPTRKYIAAELHAKFRTLHSKWEKKTYEPNRANFDKWNDAKTGLFTPTGNTEDCKIFRAVRYFFGSELCGSDNPESTRVFLAQYLVKFCTSVHNHNEIRPFVSFWYLFFCSCPGYFMADARRCYDAMYLPNNAFTNKIMSNVNEQFQLLGDDLFLVTKMANNTIYSHSDRHMHAIIQNLAWKLRH